MVVTRKMLAFFEQVFYFRSDYIASICRCQDSIMHNFPVEECRKKAVIRQLTAQKFRQQDGGQNNLRRSDADEHRLMGA